MENATDVAQLDEAREPPTGRRVDLAETLAQLRRDLREPRRGVQRRLIGHAGRFRLALVRASSQIRRISATIASSTLASC